MTVASVKTKTNIVTSNKIICSLQIKVYKSTNLVCGLFLMKSYWCCLNKVQIIAEILRYEVSNPANFQIFLGRRTRWT